MSAVAECFARLCSAVTRYDNKDPAVDDNDLFYACRVIGYEIAYCRPVFHGLAATVAVAPPIGLHAEGLFRDNMEAYWADRLHVFETIVKDADDQKRARAAVSLDMLDAIQGQAKWAAALQAYVAKQGRTVANVRAVLDKLKETLPSCVVHVRSTKGPAVSLATLLTDMGAVFQAGFKSAYITASTISWAFKTYRTLVEVLNRGLPIIGTLSQYVAATRDLLTLCAEQSPLFSDAFFVGTPMTPTLADFFIKTHIGSLVAGLQYLDPEVGRLLLRHAAHILPWMYAHDLRGAVGTAVVAATGLHPTFFAATTRLGVPLFEEFRGSQKHRVDDWMYGVTQGNDTTCYISAALNAFLCIPALRHYVIRLLNTEAATNSELLARLKGPPVPESLRMAVLRLVHKQLCGTHVTLGPAATRVFEKILRPKHRGGLGDASAVFVMMLMALGLGSMEDVAVMPPGISAMEGMVRVGGFLSTGGHVMLLLGGHFDTAVVFDSGTGGVADLRNFVTSSIYQNLIMAGGDPAIEVNSILISRTFLERFGGEAACGSAADVLAALPASTVTTYTNATSKMWNRWHEIFDETE